MKYCSGGIGWHNFNSTNKEVNNKAKQPQSGDMCGNITESAGRR